MSTTELPQRTLVVPLSDVEWRDSGDPERKDEITLRGHAAVFNSLSEDLGGFRELIEPGFFREALRRKPDVRLLINHDGLPLARTASGTLELREDERGLHVFARLDRGDPDVQSLRRKMHRRDVDQMSFAFSMRGDGDTWEDTDEGILRRLLPGGADELYDVSVVTYPAYRATEVSMRSVLQDAISRGRVPISVGQAEALSSDGEREAVAYIVPPNGSETLVLGEGGAIVGSTEVALTSANAELTGEERDAAPDVEVVAGADEPAEEDVEQAADLVTELKESTRARRDAMAESYLRLLKEHGLPT